jgi:hypothetical protein
MLQLIPEEAATNTLRGCYKYFERLKLIPEEHLQQVEFR